VDFILIVVTIWASVASPAVTDFGVGSLSLSGFVEGLSQSGADKLMTTHTSVSILAEGSYLTDNARTSIAGSMVVLQHEQATLLAATRSITPDLGMSDYPTHQGVRCPGLVSLEPSPPLGMHLDGCVTTWLDVASATVAVSAGSRSHC
jgi:hypothetical protein